VVAHGPKTGHLFLRSLATVAEMEEMVLEEWARIPQDWINELVLKQEH
jgi:hypothetical protein